MSGAFVVVDGPSGVGKSTVALLLTELLAAVGHRTHLTREPSDGPIGALARAHTYRGLTLACLVAADRYHHLDTTIRPHVAAGEIVVCDRFLPTSLVLQEYDGVPEAMVWQLNARVDRPDLTVILLGEPDVCRRRSSQRGTYSRFHQEVPDEPGRYRAVAAKLRTAGYPVVTYDIEGQTAPEVAAALTWHVRHLHTGQATAAARDTTSS